MSDPRPCNDCGKPHENVGPFDRNGKRLIDDWRDPNDRHAYYPPSWEDFARSLVAQPSTTGDGLDVERLAEVLPGFLNFRSFIVPRSVNDPAWRTLAEELAARLRGADTGGER